MEINEAIRQANFKKVLKKLKKKKWTLNYEDEIIVQFTKPFLSKDNFIVFEYFKLNKSCKACARNIDGMELHTQLPLDELELFVEYFKLRGKR